MYFRFIKFLQKNFIYHKSIVAYCIYGFFNKNKSDFSYKIRRSPVLSYLILRDEVHVYIDNIPADIEVSGPFMLYGIDQLHSIYIAHDKFDIVEASVIQKLRNLNIDV